MDPNHYQPLNSQSFLTADFDQSRMTWRRNSSLYSTEDSPMHISTMQNPQLVERKDSGGPPQVQLVPRCIEKTPVSQQRNAAGTITASNT